MRPHILWCVLGSDCMKICLEISSPWYPPLIDQLVHDVPDTGQMIAKGPGSGDRLQGFKSWLYQFTNSVTQAGHFLSPQVSMSLYIDGGDILKSCWEDLLSPGKSSGESLTHSTSKLLFLSIDSYNP